MIATSTVLEVNNLAGQIFELSTYMSSLIASNPKKIYKTLEKEHKIYTDKMFGENILR